MRTIREAAHPSSPGLLGSWADGPGLPNKEQWDTCDCWCVGCAPAGSHAPAPITHTALWHGNISNLVLLDVPLKSCNFLRWENTVLSPALSMNSRAAQGGKTSCRLFLEQSDLIISYSDYGITDKK